MRTNVRACLIIFVSVKLEPQLEFLDSTMMRAERGHISDCCRRKYDL
jgi:hypothetical protein